MATRSSTRGTVTSFDEHVGLGEVTGNPVHATGVGLLLMGSQIENPRRSVLPGGRAGGFFKRVKDWYRGEF